MILNTIFKYSIKFIFWNSFRRIVLIHVAQEEFVTLKAEYLIHYGIFQFLDAWSKNFTVKFLFRLHN